MMYTQMQSSVISHQSSVRYEMLLLCFLMLACFFWLPFIASAQVAGPYVPVVDINMEEVFPEIMTEADDSIRDIIAGSEPGGVTLDGCLQSPSRYAPDFIQWYDDEDVPATTESPYAGGPWYRAHQVALATNGTIPEPDFFEENNNLPVEIGSVVPLENPVRNPSGNPDEDEEIHSTSLRCLLISLIEWQKLSINLQIHDLLRGYIADAQNYLLNKELANKLDAAQAEHSRRGNQTCTTDPDGTVVCIDRPTFSVDRTEEDIERTGNQIRNIANQVTNAPNDPSGSLNVCRPYQRELKRNILIGNRRKLEDPAGFTGAFTSCTSATNHNPEAPFENEDFADDFFSSGGMNDARNTKGGIYSLNWMFQNPQDSPLGIASVVDQAAEERTAKELTDQQNKRLEGQGFNTEECVNPTAEDPFCVKRKMGTPGSLLQGYTYKATQTEVDPQGAFTFIADEAENKTANVSQQSGGLAEYQTKDLGNQEDQVHRAYNRIPEEFYRTIEYGYWNTTLGLARWTQATMLTIYDEMAQKETADVYRPTSNTQGTGDAVDVGY